MCILVAGLKIGRVEIPGLKIASLKIPGVKIAREKIPREKIAGINIARFIKMSSNFLFEKNPTQTALCCFATGLIFLAETSCGHPSSSSS